MLAPLIAQFLDRGEGPEQTGDFSTDPTAFLVLIIVGFLLGMAGHLYKAKTLIATGILLIFLATVGIPIFLHLTR